MQSLIGIIDSSPGYAASLAGYINKRQDIGFRSISFNNSIELDNFLISNQLSIILTDDPNHVIKYEGKADVFLLLPDRMAEKQDINALSVYKYQRAGKIMDCILPCVKNGRKSDLYTVFSPCSNERAIRYAKQKARDLATEGRTLLVFWDPFVSNDITGNDVRFSNLLFAAKKNETEFKRILADIPETDGIFAVGAVDFYSDLWGQSKEEIECFAEKLRSYGQYKSIVFECGFLSEGVEKLMEISDSVWIVNGAEYNGFEMFLKQMKYGGRHEIVARTREGI